MKNIVIFGQGYVGTAYKYLLEQAYTVIAVDPGKGLDPIIDWANVESCIVCVDTPMGEDGQCDPRDVQTVLNTITDNWTQTLPPQVLIKSTIDPTIAVNINTMHWAVDMVFSPEFLTAKNNIRDVMSQKFMIFGAGAMNELTTDYFITLFKEVLPDCRVEVCDIQTACLAKYAINSFLATKVTFFNQFEQLHKALRGTDSYDRFAELVALDSRIGAGHTSVPGLDGKYGWGGHCFEKDIPALLNFADRLRVDVSAIAATHTLNKKHRQ